MAFNWKKYQAAYKQATALYGDPWVLNTPFIMFYTLVGGRYVDARPKTCAEVGGAATYNAGAKFYADKDAELSASYAEAAIFAAENPTEFAPNPKYNENLVTFDALAWQAYMNANAY